MHYRRLGKMREDEIFSDGDFAVLSSKGGLLVFERRSPGRRVIVAVNASDRAVSLGKTYKGYDMYNERYAEISSVPAYGFSVIDTCKSK